MAEQTDWDAWEAWTGHLASDPDEDFTSTFTHVRLNRAPETQVEWARDWRTREFCNLGLHLLYEHHVRRLTTTGIAKGVKLFADLGPQDLANHAQVMIKDGYRAKQLGVDRYNATWGHRSAFIEDLLAYLFRPAPYLRRLKALHPLLLAQTSELTLGELIRVSSAAELESTLEDPLIALQTFVQAAMPAHPAVRAYIRRMDEASLLLWSDLYAAAFPQYGLNLRPSLQWRDVAELFTTAIEGTLLRTRVGEGVPTLSNGDDVLAAQVLAMLPYLFGSTIEEIEHLRAATTSTTDGSDR